MPRFLVLPRESAELGERLREPRLERAIRVIHRPDSERMSHYFHCRLSEQFDSTPSCTST